MARQIRLRDEHRGDHQHRPWRVRRLEAARARRVRRQRIRVPSEYRSRDPACDAAQRALAEGDRAGHDELLDRSQTRRAARGPVARRHRQRQRVRGAPALRYGERSEGGARHPRARATRGRREARGVRLGAVHAHLLVLVAGLPGRRDHRSHRSRRQLRRRVPGPSRRVRLGRRPRAPSGDPSRDVAGRYRLLQELVKV
jgi:hypothetical protein